MHKRPIPLLFVEQDGLLWVVKGFRRREEPAGRAQARLERELAGIQAFRELGHDALQPASKPYDRLVLQIDGKAVTVLSALIYPYVDRPVLYDLIAEAQDPIPIIQETARRIAERHRQAQALAAVHSDGSAHNILEEWCWLDFCEPHSATELDPAKADEVVRFVSSVIEVSPAGTEVERTRAFCDAYAQADVLHLAVERARPRGARPRLRTALRMAMRPDKYWRLTRGETWLFRRARTWRALDTVVDGGH